jgi:hypothetical protein
MANKYDKYFLVGPQPHYPKMPRNMLSYLNNKVMEGSNYYSIHWVMQTPGGPEITPKPKAISHGPHFHKDAEILICLGTDPTNPWDLGAECELSMGPELEKHSITQTTTIFIPPKMIHCPWIIKKVTRPFIFISIDQCLVHTEKSCMKLIPEEDRENMIFIDEGFGQEKPIVHSPFRDPKTGELLKKWT